MSVSMQVAARLANWSRYALLAPATVIASVLANAVLYYIASAFVAYDPEFLPLEDVSGAIVCTAIFAVGAVLVYAGLRRFTRNPVRNFYLLSAIVFVVATIPDFTYVPGLAGVTNGQVAVLVVMHVVAAGIIVWMLTRSDRSRV